MSQGAPTGLRKTCIVKPNNHNSEEAPAGETTPGKKRGANLLRSAGRGWRRSKVLGVRAGRFTGERFARLSSLPRFEAARSWFGDNKHLLARDAMAGVVSAIVTIVYCVSFSALIFQGDLAVGLSLGLWGLLMGAAVTGIYIALTTSLIPADAGPDTPAVAVMSVLAATIGGQVLARGGSPELAAVHALLGLTFATAVTGGVLYVLGRYKLGQLVRFVPYPVISGFLAASGWLLISGALEVITGRNLALFDAPGGLDSGDVLKIAIAVLFTIVVILGRRRWDSVLVLPISFFAFVVALDLVLWALGSSGSDGGWFLSGAANLQPWVPLKAMISGDIDWGVILGASVEIGAVAGVTLVALLLDVSSLEVARSTVADLDGEFQSNGMANLIAAPLGGMSGNLSMQSSKLLEETGTVTRAGGVIAALTILLVVVTRLDVPALVPAPLLAGLLMYLGLLILREALLEAPARRTWLDLAMALGIMFAIVQFGYLVGVMLGLAGASLLFAFSYSRIGVIQRHLTRAQFSSNVERSSVAAQLLRADGEQIHVFWLSGFIFFGSSNGVFERLRIEIERERSCPIRYIILDFAAVSGFDTSAVLSLVKLRNFCDTHGVTLLYAGLSVPMLVAFERAELFGGDGSHAVFPTRNDALEWCEDTVLQHLEGDSEPQSTDAFMRWLGAELGEEEAAVLIDRYFERRAVEAGITLYRQGEPSDTIDLIAAGSVAVSVNGDGGKELKVRRMAGHTVVGEMGFFRGMSRAASVSSEGATVVFTMDRASFDQMLRDDADIAAVFLQFIIRALSDRVEFANQEISALM